jgi:hypothetical protein
MMRPAVSRSAACLIGAHQGVVSMGVPFRAAVQKQPPRGVEWRRFDGRTEVKIEMAIRRADLGAD